MPSPLIAPEDLHALEGAVLLDARPFAAFATGHLRGALNADADRQLSRASQEGFDPAVGGRHPLPSLLQWRTTLGLWGIGPATPVVVYDEQSGANAAARVWWMLRAVGHADARVLDGGLPAALAAGWESTAERAEPKACGHYPAPAWLLPTADMEVVEQLAQHGAWRVLDVRSQERYEGRSEPFDPTPGHIPGALNLPYADNLDAGGRFKSAPELQTLYLQLLDGVKPDHLVVHCGSGITACHTLLALEVAGLGGAALYVGSWSQWCRSGKPIALGEA